MICLVLAAGYATRLYPLTKDYPKPLLKISNTTILDWLLDDIDSTGEIERYVVVANHKFYMYFKQWAAWHEHAAPIIVLDDGSTENDNRLGAVGDIQYAINVLSIDDDLLVIAADNVLDFSLSSFIQYYRYKQTPVIMRYWEKNVERLKTSGVVEIDESDEITRMEEKPTEPFAHWCTPPFYIYPRSVIPLIVQANCNVDAPGSLVAHIIKHIPVHAMEMHGKRYDIGDLESYEAVQKNFAGIKGCDFKPNVLSGISI